MIPIKDKYLFTSACAQILVTIPDYYLWREKVLHKGDGF